MIYAPNGLKYLVSVKSTAKAMSIDSGLTGIVTPVHNGAQNFWKAKGKTLTAEQSDKCLRSFRLAQQLNNPQRTRALLLIFNEQIGLFTKRGWTKGKFNENDCVEKLENS